MELTLTQAIGAGDPRNLQLISVQQLQLKIELCEKLLKLLSVLAAGTDQRTSLENLFNQK